jgi:CheY-like chemotaxis protein
MPLRRHPFVCDDLLPHSLAPRPFILSGIPDPDDLFSFADENSDATDPESVAHTPWVILIVDDEPMVHEATTLTLQRGRVNNRPFSFLHAYSASEAQALIAGTEHIDLVLLDVVMETRDAGLKLVTTLRGPMGRKDLKIIIRTGQPGLENETAVRDQYPVDGYIRKTEQTFTLMMDVIRSLLLGQAPDLDSSN